MRLDPLLYAHPLTGAVMPITPDLLAETYMAPHPIEWDIGPALADPKFPWAISCGIAPDEVRAAVERALRNIMAATPKLDPTMLVTRGLPASRARRHLEALHEVWERIGTLPADLAVIRHVLSCDADQALASLPLIPQSDDRFASLAESALATHLLALHGTATDAQRDAWLSRQPTGATNGSLAHVQQNLLAGASPMTRDEGLAFYSLHGSFQEARFAAALARQMLEDGRAASASDIAVLLPEGPVRLAHLAEAFAAQGVPLSGLPQAAAQRDLAGELATLTLRVLRAPAPAMALASLAVLPMMPWENAAGMALARDLMRGNYRPKIAERLEGKAAALWDALQSGASTAKQLSYKLGVMSEALVAPAGLETACTAAQGLLRQLQAVVGEGAPDWVVLSRLISLRQPITLPVSRLVDGVSLMSAGDLPWRQARHMIVTGFAAGAYPSGVGVSPFFLDSEIAEIRRSTGLQLPSRELMLRRGLTLFARQLAVASQSVTFLCPQRDGMGRSLAPPMTLSLIARLLEGGEKNLIQDLSAVPPEGWPVAHYRVPPLPASIPPLPEDGIAHLGRRDLLRLNEDDAGRALPQSPSRLETLLVSPLAWFLGETDATDLVWSPEKLDIMLAGTLAHHVLENVFPANTQLPDAAALPALTEASLAQGISRHARFLSTAEWQLERETLRREALQATRIWHGILSGTGATIVHNEVRLEGSAHGIAIRGRADCILRLSSDQVVIVDHKKSGSSRRRMRMQAGWDLQIGLYRAMLAHPIRRDRDGLDQIAGHTPAIAYHLLNDGTVLINGLDPVPGERVEAVGGDISARAVALLQTRLAEVGGGSLRLNGTEDEVAFSKVAAITAYALDASPLLRRFMANGLSVALVADEEELP